MNEYFPVIYKEPKECDFLLQGDIFHVDLFPQTNVTRKLFKDITGWILLNADCDVIKPKRINFFVFSAIYPISSFLRNRKNDKDAFSNLIYHKLKEFYFLYPDGKFIKEGSYVEFGFLHTISSSFKHFDKNGKELSTYQYLLSKLRFRLNIDYRNHFRYRLSNYFNRIGIPDLNKKNISKWANSIIDSYN